MIRAWASAHLPLVLVHRLLWPNVQNRRVQVEFSFVLPRFSHSPKIDTHPRPEDVYSHDFYKSKRKKTTSAAEKERPPACSLYIPPEKRTETFKLSEYCGHSLTNWELSPKAVLFWFLTVDLRQLLFTAVLLIAGREKGAATHLPVSVPCDPLRWLSRLPGRARVGWRH